MCQLRRLEIALDRNRQTRRLGPQILRCQMTRTALAAAALVLLLLSPAEAAQCLRSPEQVRAVHGKTAWPVWRLRVKGHAGRKCWQAGERRKVTKSKKSTLHLPPAFAPALAGPEGRRGGHKVREMASARTPEQPRPMTASPAPDGAPMPSPSWQLSDCAELYDWLRPDPLPTFAAFATVAYAKSAPAPERHDGRAFVRAFSAFMGAGGLMVLLVSGTMSWQRKRDEESMRVTLRNLRIAQEMSWKSSPNRPP